MTRIASSTVLGGVLAGLLFAAAPAQAVTTDATVTSGTEDVITVTDQSSTVTDYTFDFTVNPSTLYVDFTTTGTFDLLLVSFDDFATGGSDVTGYLLENLDTNTRKTTDVAFCGAALGFTGADCNLIADSDAAGANAAATKDAGSPVLLLSDLAAGSYRLGIFDSATPNPGQAVLRVSEIPTPMAGLMLVSALGLWRAGSRKSA